MSTPSRRRNHSLASCEPCRKGKIRCDHQQPVCASCRRRGRESRCWYHPAPLTKQQNTPRRILSTPYPPVSVIKSFKKNPVNSHNSLKPTTSIRAPSFQTWPFIPDANGSTIRSSVSESHNEKARDEHLASLEEILSALIFLPRIEKLLHDYFVLIHTALVPKAIVLQLLGMVRDGMRKSGYIKEKPDSSLRIQNISQLAESILYSSSSEASISATMDVKGFCAIFCEDNLRVETLGLLYTLAARASLYDSYHDKIRDNEFIREMCWYSNLSLRLARELAPQTTDLIIWLAHENLQLVTLLEGDASKSHNTRGNISPLTKSPRLECLASSRRPCNRPICIRPESRSNILFRRYAILPCRVSKENICQGILSGQDICNGVQPPAQDLI